MSGALAIALGVAPAGAVVPYYSWQVRPNIGDSYTSKGQPQPVCVSMNGVGKILIFTNQDFYKSQNLYNASNAVRVGVITTPADTYALAGGYLTGKRYDFAVASHTPPGGNSKVYLFGGRNGTGDLDDIYVYDPVTDAFGQVTNSSGTPVTLPTPRSGVTAVSSGGLIWLFGGINGHQLLNDVLVFDPTTKTVSARPAMAKAFYGARAMVKAVGADNYVYLTGARIQDGGALTFEVYRYRTLPTPGPFVTVLNAQAGGAPMQSGLSPAAPMISWNPSGAVLLLASGLYGYSGLWTWGRFDVGTLTDTYGSSGNPMATFGPAPYNAPARARNVAGAVKCGASTYLIGGDYGHGPTLEDRSFMLDRLSGPTIGTATLNTSTVVKQVHPE